MVIALILLSISPLLCLAHEELNHELNTLTEFVLVLVVTYAFTVLFEHDIEITAEPGPTYFQR